MNKINEKMDCQTRLCKSAVSGDWTSADLAQKSKTEPHHSPRAGAKIFARRIGSTPQIAHIQKSGAQSYARSPRSFEAVAQAGRSMIEMLGVLAIIGVLTIGGLMGYRYAMNKHKANTILNDVSLAMADLTVQDPDGGAIARQAVAFNPDSGLAMESERTEDGNNIVYVNGVPKAVCQILIQIKPTDAYENIYDGDLNALTSCNDNQTMAFGSKDSGETPVTPECQNDSNCAADEICQNGHCVVKPIPTDPCDPNPCSNGGTCSNGECTCINGFTGKYCDDAPECIVDEQCDILQFCQNYVCVCQNLEACVTQNADTCACDKCDAEYIKKDGKCEKCTAPKVPNADQTACECPKIENCKTYNDTTCACDTCEDGFEMVDGKCVKNDCPTGQKSVTNYDSAGNNIGTACCEVKEDSTETHNDDPGTTRTLSKKGYTVTGAINGTCCGGYAIEDYYYTDTATGSTTCYPDSTLRTGCLSLTYQVFVNGGKAYCGQSVTDWKELKHTTVDLYKRYISSSKMCRIVGEPIPMCTCSSSGDPANGSSCN